MFSMVGETAPGTAHTAQAESERILDMFCGFFGHEIFAKSGKIMATYH